MTSERASEITASCCRLKFLWWSKILPEFCPRCGERTRAGLEHKQAWHEEKCRKAELKYHMGLSTRLSNILYSMGVTTIEAARKVSVRDLAAKQNCGPDTIREFKNKVQEESA